MGNLTPEEEEWADKLILLLAVKTMALVTAEGDDFELLYREMRDEGSEGGVVQVMAAMIKQFSLTIDEERCQEPGTHLREVGVRLQLSEMQ